MLEKSLYKGHAYDGAHLPQVRATGLSCFSKGLNYLSCANSSQGRIVVSAELAGIELTRRCYGANESAVLQEQTCSYLVHVLTHGRAYWKCSDGKLVSVSPGDSILAQPQDGLVLSSMLESEMATIRIPVEMLNATWVEKYGSLPSDGLPLNGSKVGLAQTGGLLQFLDLLFAEMSGKSKELSSLEPSYREILLNKIIQQFSIIVPESDVVEISDPAFSGIVSYIDQNIKSELGVDELARKGGISIRTLYNYFAKYFSSTPKLYIKEEKLKKLRSDLVSNSRFRSVTEVALEYGFMHLGRFSSEYKKMFGELPSETLKRHR